MMHTEGFVKT